jgi:hypothetical protein
MKNTSDSASIPENRAKAEESAGPNGRKDILKRTLLVVVFVLAWLAIKRLVVTLGNENLMILLILAATALVFWVVLKMKW